MITRERLTQSDYGRGLLTLMDRLTPYKVTRWTTGSGDGAQDGRESASSLGEGNVITSRYANLPAGHEPRHAIVLDIDHPSWLIPSTTPNHYHLYIDVPGGVDESSYFALLDLLGRFGIIERGYAKVSMNRGYTSVRFPWIEKPKPDPEEFVF